MPTVKVSPELLFDWLVPFVSCFVEQIRNSTFAFVLADKLYCPEYCLILCVPFVASLCRSLGRLWALDLNH